MFVTGNLPDLSKSYVRHKDIAAEQDQHVDLLKVLQMPDVLQRFGEIVVDAAPQSRDEVAAFPRAEMTRWALVVKDAGIPTQ